MEPITRRELDDVVDVWCDAVLEVEARDLKMMRSYLDLQIKMWNAEQRARVEASPMPAVLSA